MPDKDKEKEKIKEKLNEYFNREKINTRDVFNQLSLYIFSIEDKHSDLHVLAKLLPEEFLYKIINYYDGSTLKIPTKQKYQKALLLAIVYFFYEVKHLSWDEIKELMKLDKVFPEHSPISLGKRIVKIRDSLNKDLANVLSKLDLNTVMNDMLDKNTRDK